MHKHEMISGAAMLKIAKTLQQLNFSSLMDIYIEGNVENGRYNYPEMSAQEQLREAEQDFYQYLQSVFFRQEDSYYAIWEADGCYRSALRLEPYADGLLLCALETAPESRRQGYASALIKAVLEHLSARGSGVVYSHVSKRNVPSLKVHEKCGFEIIKDHAVYSDGSVLNSHVTLACVYEKSET